MAGKLNYKKYRKIILSIGCLITLTVAIVYCYLKPIYYSSLSPPLPLPSSQLLQRGDWILRSDIEGDNEIIKYFSHSQYSHIGIIVETQPNIIVAHATTNDEPEYPNQVLLTPLNEFMATNQANAIAIVRPNFLSIYQREATAEYAKQQHGRKFILTHQNKQPFYCNILLLEAIQQQPDFSPQWQYLDIPLQKDYYLFPEAFIHKDITWIYKVNNTNSPQ